MTSARKLNIEYALLQGFYWMGYCTCVSYAAVFLQYRGYSNTVLGLVIALGSCGGLLLSPVTADIVDRSKRIDVYGMLFAMLVCQFGILFAVSRLSGLLLSAAYCIYIAVFVSVNPLLTQLVVEIESTGNKVNYGIARGTGSLCYAPFALVLGNLMTASGPDIMPLLSAVLTVIVAAELLILKLSVKRLKSEAGVSAVYSASADVRREGVDLLHFFSKYRRFTVLLAGIALIFFAHSIVNSFMINIVHNIGGDTSDLGIITALGAFSEIPMMFLFDRITRRVRCGSVIRFAAIFFAVKSVLYAVSGSVTALTLTHMLQMFSYAVIIPALVRYVTLTIDPADSAKGQSLSYNMTTLGAVLANLFGGLMFDRLSAFSSMVIGAAICIAGAAICFFSVQTSAKEG